MAGHPIATEVIHTKIDKHVPTVEAKDRELSKNGDKSPTHHDGVETLAG